MAAAVVIGTVSFLMIGRASAQIEMLDADGVREKLQLWSGSAAQDPDRETQILWTGICQDALLYGAELMVATEGENSAQILSIRINPAPPPVLADTLAAALHQLL